MDAEKIALGLIRKHEGFRQMPYKDETGHLTIGFGHNLDEHGISRTLAEIMLLEDMERCTRALKGFRWYEKQSDIRKAVLIDMCFNLGIYGLLGFNKTLFYVGQELHKEAADEMLKSTWAKQVGDRAIELAYMMEHNKMRGE